MKKIFNTHEQLVATGGGIAITRNYTAGKRNKRNGWRVIKVNADGSQVPTNLDAAWYHYGQKAFMGKAMESLQRAKDWCEKTYGEKGPWARNHSLDYVPARINKQFPIRKPKAG